MRGTVLTEAPAGEQGGHQGAIAGDLHMLLISATRATVPGRHYSSVLYVCVSARSGKHSGSHEGLTVRSPRRPSRRPSLLSLGVVCLWSLVSNG